MMQQLFSDPAALRQMIDSNPMLSGMVNSNPQMRAALENPAMLQMMQQMMADPNALGNRLVTIGNLLGGMGGAGGMGGLGGAGGLPPNLAGMFGGAGAGAGAGFGGAGGANAGLNLGAFMPPPAQVNPALPPEERYRDQLQQMSDMGFTNKDLNIQMLDQTGGNVQLAIERLLTFLG